jgi:hypothetical protein
MTDGAGHSQLGIVRGCPLRTGRDSCEWHGGGTTDEDDVRATGSVCISSTVAQGPSPADAGLVGKPPFGGAAALDSIATLLDEGESMEQDRDGEGPTGAWPWLLLLVVAGLVALAVVMWRSETVRLIWADLWELVRSSRR